MTTEAIAISDSRFSAEIEQMLARVPKEIRGDWREILSLIPAKERKSELVQLERRARAYLERAYRVIESKRAAEPPMRVGDIFSTRGGVEAPEFYQVMQGGIPGRVTVQKLARRRQHNTNGPLKGLLTVSPVRDVFVGPPVWVTTAGRAAIVLFDEATSACQILERFELAKAQPKRTPHER